jgi:hypothetical protein
MKTNIKQTVVQILLLFSIVFTASSQNVTVTDVRIKYCDIEKKLVDYSGENGHNSLIVFPIVKIGNQETEKKIQFEILKSLRLDTLLVNYPVKAIIDSSVYYGLTGMNYQVTFNKNNILSLTINYFHCGANCWDTKVFLNFDLSNGNLLTINDLVNPLEKETFIKHVLSEKQSKLKLYKDSLINQFDTINSKDENESYKYIIEEIKKCEKSVFIEKFQIEENKITIYDKCYWAYYLSNYEPELFIIYSLTDNSKYFKTDFMEKTKKQLITSTSRVGKGEFDSVDFQFTPKPLSEQ